jgi:hypothetical protein
VVSHACKRGLLAWQRGIDLPRNAILLWGFSAGVMMFSCNSLIWFTVFGFSNVIAGAGRFCACARIKWRDVIF